MLEQAPDWMSIRSKMDFSKITDATQDPNFVALVHRVNNKEYLYWDRFKQIYKLTGLSAEEAWAYIRLVRFANSKKIPLRDTKNRVFSYWLPDGVYEDLHFTDQHAAGEILVEHPDIPKSERERFVISSLMEEAIASSQLEGAATTREVAKRMLRLGEKPKDKSEQMIFNNYQAMKHVKELTQKPLSVDMLNDIQAILTKDTLDDSATSGRFRTDDAKERVHVVDNSTGEILHVPPPAGELSNRIDQLCKFANEEDHYGFMHPVVKAIILHFWLAYIHPYVDGNGRTARTLFYWFMLKKGYYMTEYLAISRIIKDSPSQYKKAYLYSEIDSQDLTYFISFHMHTIRKAFDDMKQYLIRKSQEHKEAMAKLARYPDLNARQSQLLYHALTKPGSYYTIESHMNLYGVTYETSRTDLLDLENKGFLTKVTKGKSFIYLPADDLKERIKPPKKTN